MEENHDYISKLPHTLLSTILSSLKIREAVRTSVLSTRWRRLWTTPINLTFDADNMLEAEEYSGSYICHVGHLQSYLIKMKRTFAFLNNVNQFLAGIREGHKIGKLKVCFTFRHNRYANHLDDLIHFAIARHVEEIDLCLLEEHPFSAPNEGELYAFPCDLLVANGIADGFKSCLKRLRLAHCIFAPFGSNFSGLSTLTTLDLVKVDLVSTEHIQVLLSDCHNLEWLSFSGCCNADHLRIQHPFCQQLKYLNVNDCHQLKTIELKGTNLETLEYKGPIIEFLFCNAPRLKTVFTQCQ